MPTPVIESIAADIASKINEIRTENKDQFGDAWNQDLYAVRPTRIGLEDAEELDNGKALVVQGYAEKDEENSAEGNAYMTAWRQQFAIAAIIKLSDSNTDPVDTTINNAASDIVKKLTEDCTRGGYAIDTVILGYTETLDEMPEFSGVVVTIEVFYRTRFNDPCTKA